MLNAQTQAALISKTFKSEVCVLDSLVQTLRTRYRRLAAPKPKLIPSTSSGAPFVNRPRLHLKRELNRCRLANGLPLAVKPLTPCMF